MAIYISGQIHSPSGADFVIFRKASFLVLKPMDIFVGTQGINHPGMVLSRSLGQASAMPDVPVAT